VAKRRVAQAQRAKAGLGGLRFRLLKAWARSYPFSTPPRTSFETSTVTSKWRVAATAVASDEWRVRERTGDNRSGEWPFGFAQGRLVASKRKNRSGKAGPVTRDQKAREKQVPRLRDPTRQTSARRKRSGRSARDDKKGVGQEGGGDWRCASAVPTIWAK